jgi:hypothetical protein
MFAEDRNGSLWAHGKAVLALPASTPAKAVKVFDDGEVVHKFEHLSGADVHALATAGAFILVNVKFSFILLHNAFFYKFIYQ